MSKTRHFQPHLIPTFQIQSRRMSLAWAVAGIGHITTCNLWQAMGWARPITITTEHNNQAVPPRGETVQRRTSK